MLTAQELHDQATAEVAAMAQTVRVADELLRALELLAEDERGTFGDVQEMRRTLDELGREVSAVLARARAGEVKVNDPTQMAIVLTSLRNLNERLRQRNDRIAEHLREELRS